MSFPRVFPLPPLALALVAPLACSAAGGSESAWTGAVDTLASGVIAVANEDRPVWNDASAWRVTEDLRIGTLEGDGPDLFGNITHFTIDGWGRFYVLEGQAQELRVFDATGVHVRTVGRKGSGPGEFAQALKLDWAPDGSLWIADPENNRISVFDTAGAYVAGKRAPGGFIMIPWPGGFDEQGRYYSPVPLQDEDEFRWVLVQFTPELAPTDTLVPPDDPVERPFFELRSEHGHMMASVPFTPSLQWRLSPSGGFWGLLTGEYRLFRMSEAGDTVRTIARAYEPLPVTGADIDEAIDDMEWFRQQGGKVDRSKFPATKPAARDFFIDDGGYLWVLRVVADAADEDRVLDVFDPEGRFLGTVRLPFRLSRNPAPVFRGGFMYAVTKDDLEVPYLVRARVDRP